MVKVSIIIPVYNAESFIEKTLQSVLNQSIDDYEIICIDDGSTDNSLTVLNEFAKKYDFIKIIKQKNTGSGEARNRGIIEAKGEYISFLDADDIYLDSDALNKVYDIAIKNDYNMVAANLKQIKPDGTLEENYDYKNTLFTYFVNEKEISPKEYGIPWAFYKNIYKKSFIETHNICFPSLRRGQDPIFLAEVLVNIDKIYTMPIDLYGYNHSASGGVNLKVNSYLKKRDYIQHFKDTFEILKKNEFNEALSNYKYEFIQYLTFRQNLSDSDIKRIVTELFDDCDYFKETDYGYFILDLIKNPEKEVNSDYKVVKMCLFEESMIENTFIDFNTLKTFTEMSKQDNELLKISYNQLKDIEYYTFEEKRVLNGTLDKLKNEIKKYIKSNDAILISNSWKFTSYLRSLKHKL